MRGAWLALKLEIPGHLDGEGIYAIRQDKGRPLVGLRKVTREELDKPITIVMHPACRVLFRIESTGLPALEKKYHAELTGPGWWRAAYVVLGGGIQTAPRPLFASSTNGELEFLLPPGRVTIHAYGSDVQVGRALDRDQAGRSRAVPGDARRAPVPGCGARAGSPTIIGCDRTERPAVRNSSSAGSVLCRFAAWPARRRTSPSRPMASCWPRRIPTTPTRAR